MKFGPSAVSPAEVPDFRAAPPPACSADRPTVGTHGNRPASAELFGSPLGMAFGTEAADVAVLVRSAMGQRHNVVRYGRLANNPGGCAVAAERLGLEATNALGDARSPSETLHANAHPL